MEPKGTYNYLRVGTLRHYKLIKVPEGTVQGYVIQQWMSGLEVLSPGGVSLRGQSLGLKLRVENGNLQCVIRLKT